MGGAAAVGLTEEALKEWTDKNSKSEPEKPKEDDALSTASALLSDSRKIRSVHSARSVAAVAKQSKRSTLNLPQIKEVPAPRVVTLDEKRLDYQSHVNQLPYM